MLTGALNAVPKVGAKPKPPKPEPKANAGAPDAAPNAAPNAAALAASEAGVATIAGALEAPKTKSSALLLAGVPDAVPKAEAVEDAGVELACAAGMTKAGVLGAPTVGADDATAPTGGVEEAQNGAGAALPEAGSLLTMLEAGTAKVDDFPRSFSFSSSSTWALSDGVSALTVVGTS